MWCGQTISSLWNYVSNLLIFKSLLNTLDRPPAPSFSRHVSHRARIQRLLCTRLQHLTLQDAILPLKPADRLYLLYLFISLPLCFSIGNGTPTYWIGVTYRLTIIPLFILIRMCFCSPLTGPILARWYQQGLLDLTRRYQAIKRLLTRANRFSDSSFFLAIKGSEYTLFALTMLVDGIVPFASVYHYTEAHYLIENVHRGVRYDDTVMLVEEIVFMGQPSQYLREIFPSRLLGEYLHLCYFLYYFILVLGIAVVYFLVPRQKFDMYCFAVGISTYGNYMIHLLLPVEGPYWRLPRAPAEDLCYYMCHVVRSIMVGSSNGTALPSSHCGITCAILMGNFLFRQTRFFGFTMLPVVPAIWFSTMWCGFHYATDVVLGLSLATVGIVFGMGWARSMKYRRSLYDLMYTVDAEHEIVTV